MYRLLVISSVLFIGGILFSRELESTPYNIGEYLVYLTAYILAGRRVIARATKNLITGKVFDEHFLMLIATLGAIAIKELPEAVAVMLFYEVGELIQGSAVRKSRKSIKDLLEIRPQYANIRREYGVEKVNPADVRIGEIVIVKAGEKIPLDGIIIEGGSYLDTFPLTGETFPRGVEKGDNVLAGMVNKTGLLAVEVTGKYEDSSISKIMDLLETATKRKAKTERFISTFASYYTPVVVIAAMMVAFLPPLLFGYSLSDWVYRALVMLVVSCPCALVVSIPLGYFGGLGGASKNGILIKGATFLDALVNIKTVVFDKTGTLTEGKLAVKGIKPIKGIGEEELLRLFAEVESQSTHPIADAILKRYGKEIDPEIIESYEELPGLGIRAVINRNKIMAGNSKFMKREGINLEDGEAEESIVHLAVEGEYYGTISISDRIREDSKGTIEKLKEMGVEKIIMLTGDNQKSAKRIAGELGIEEFYAEMLPEHKVAKIEEFLSNEVGRGKLLFIGDGINDAPVIARADVGIAMGGIGSDAAIEAADIVFIEDNPSKLIDSLKIAKKTRGVVWQNIVFALGVKLVFLVLGGLGVASMWEAVFADMGVALIAIFNASRMLKKL
jgi:Zn2+/Cd2+-exporting ATPase